MIKSKETAHMEKILTFIIRKNKLLLLLGSDTDPQFKESFWYVITGGVENKDINLYETVKREVKEETNLNLSKIIDLNLTFEYESLNMHCVEHVFISYTTDDDSNIILNEESIKYKWCSLDEFIDLIKWYYDKSNLKAMLKKYIN